MTQAQQQPKLPISQGWSRRRYSIPRMNMTIGLISGQTQVEVPHNGLATAIRLQFVVKATLAAGAAFKDPVQQLWALISNITLKNNDNVVIINAEGYSCHIDDVYHRYANDHTISPINDVTITPAADNYLQFDVLLRLTPNMGRNALWGLMPIQAATTSWQIIINWLDINQVISNVTSASGYVDGTLYYFDIPDLNKYAAPPFIYQYNLTDKRIRGQLGDGDFSYELAPLNGTLVQTHLQFMAKRVDNNQPVAYQSNYNDYNTVVNGNKPNVSRLAMWLNNTELQERYSVYEHDIRHFEEYGLAPFPGTYTFVNGLAVLDTEVGSFVEPNYMWGFLDPADFASARLVATTAGGDSAVYTPDYVRLINRYFSDIVFRS